MRRRMYETDMSKGSIFKKLILFVVPLILGNVLQLLYNAADIIVVSRWAGSNAMASVGSTSSLNALLINVFIGISIGASVVVSKRYGAKDYEGIYRSVHTSMLLGIIVGFIALVLGQFLCRKLLILMGTPEGPVLDGAVLYMRIFFIGAPASLVYNFGAAILRAIGDTKRPLYILAATGIVNVILNLFLVIKFNMGVEGVAIATAVANYLSALAVLYALIRSDAVYKLILKEMRFYKDDLKEILRIGLPAGLQSSVFSLSNTVIQSAVNSFGTAAIAGSAAASNIEGFVYTSMNAFHQATITAVSQNYGAKNEKRVKQSITISVLCVAIVGFVLGSATVIFDDALLSIYITDSFEAVEFAKVRVLLNGLPYFLCGVMDVLAGALRGLGYSTITAVNSLLGACGLRILWIFFILPLCRSPYILFACWPVSWFLVIIMHTIYLMIVKKKAMQKMYEL